MIKTQVDISSKRQKLAQEIAVGELFRTVLYKGDDWFMRIHHAPHCEIGLRDYFIYAVSMRDGIVSLVRKDAPVIRAKEMIYTVGV